MIGGELYTREEMQQMIDNTRGFFDYCKLQEQIERDEDSHGAFSWLFSPSFVPLPLDPEEAKKISKSDIWWIDKIVYDACQRAWNTPAEFRVEVKGEEK